MNKNYCLTMLGESNGYMDTIMLISNGEVKHIDGEGLVILTFSSNNTVKEISKILKSKNLSFLIFEINPKTSAYNIIKKEIHDGLFGQFDNIKKTRTEVDKLFNEEFFANTENSNLSEDKKITKEDILEMTREEKDVLMNKIIDGGLENMSVYHKEILPLLVK